MLKVGQTSRCLKFDNIICNGFIFLDLKFYDIHILDK